MRGLWEFSGADYWISISAPVTVEGCEPAWPFLLAVPQINRLFPNLFSSGKKKGVWKQVFATATRLHHKVDRFPPQPKQPGYSLTQSKENRHARLPTGSLDASTIMEWFIEYSSVIFLSCVPRHSELIHQHVELCKFLDLEF